ncbi:MAG: hypothetical protein HY899_18735 [Deltaproteobacteria bacterium]|nr:hypothetical protein [Deltaproteobacteria bacterium]
MRVIQVAHRLVDLAASDSLYADRYLERAVDVLGTTLPRRQYVALRNDYNSVPRLTEDLRDAVEKQDWQLSLMLAARVKEVRARVLVREPFLRIGDAVYGPHPVQFSGTALALNGVVAGRCADLPQARASTVEQLGTLAREDHEWSAFYRQRIEHFEHLHVAAEQQPGAVIEGTEVRTRILAAVDRASFAQVQELVSTILSRDTDAVARLRSPLPDDAAVRTLADAFPAPDGEPLQRLGLKEEMLPALENLNEYLGCACTDRPTMPKSPLAGTHRKAETRTCGHDCPPEIRGVLRENLDLLMLHVFVTSCGTRYLPWFGTETLLVEDFAESDSEARTPLLDMLKLPKRSGLPRIAIEDALRSRGADLVRELGLDPTDFVAICIPFDAYLRLAPAHGWGCKERWTHFDGYQVCRDLRLRALVGGDVRFGGPDDLCSVGCDYDSDRLTARFAVVRRQRVTVRGGMDAN